MSNDDEVIYIAASTEQAHILRNLLEEYGIAAYVTNETLQFGVGDLPFGLPTAPRVMVMDKHDAEAAREVALAFDRSGHCCRHDGQCKGQGGSSQAEMDEYEVEGSDDFADWPACPSCRRPRQTSCPVCETSGSKFPRAFMPDEDVSAGEVGDDAETQLLVLCPTCDDPFAPVFLARCEWCGYRFRDGRELRLPQNLTPLFAEMNARVWTVIIGLAAVAAGAVALLAYIAPKT